MTTNAAVAARPSFFEELREQRWDDHRYYHQSRINQTLHFISALTFLTSFVVVFFNPALAALLGWLVAMVTRQSGHFFFEPKGYDEVNQATHAHKEAIKVGYNLQRKVILHAAWLALPLILIPSPTVFGLLDQVVGAWGYLMNIGMIWFALGVAAIVIRVLYLSVTRHWQVGICWATKILTDPFHDIALYWRSPLALLRGELIDPMDDVVAPPAGSRAGHGA